MKLKAFLIMIVAIALPTVALSACTQPSANTTAPTPEPTATTETVEENSNPPKTETSTEQAAVPEPDKMVDFIEGPVITTDSGLQYAIFEEGTGELPRTGDIVRVHYTGKLSDGLTFDSSLDRDDPIQFSVGTGQVIPGWDEAMQLLRVGDKARLIIPPELAYGETGVGQDIPPDSTLYFEVELVDVMPAVNEPPTEINEADYVATGSGLKYYDIVVGDGDAPRAGEMPLVHYTGWLEDGTKIDSSRDRGTPLHFTLGVEQVIPGWEEGIGSMTVGSRRQLIIPPELAFGEAGAGNGLIPPNATLIYEVELIAISDYHP